MRLVDRQQIEIMVADAAKQLDGGIDVLVNNAASRCVLTADAAADAAAGLAVTANALAMLNDPAGVRDLTLSSGFFVADYLPALVNALRVFLGVGAVLLFWIVTDWSSGLQAVVFAAVTIMIFSPMQEPSGRAAFGQWIGTGIAVIAGAVVKFLVLQGYETFFAFSFVIVAALVPLGALLTVPRLRHLLPGRF
jgi:uncharacterized membrane protein YccC